ncbi:MAG: acyl--CoA ligase [Ruminococcus sp.]|nr:acyl--CoA ligase [Ruminococcus sp.]
MEPKAPWRRFYADVKPHLHYPEITLWQALWRIACKYPHSTALIYMNRKISYKEMTERIACVQTGLESLGVRRGDKVTVSLPNTPQAVYLLYALSRMGAVACFVHPLSAGRELEEYVRITDSRCVVMLSSQYRALRNKEKIFEDKTVIVTNPWDELIPRYSIVGGAYNKVNPLCWQRMMKAKAEKTDEAENISAQSPAVVLFSGGTTGKPKAVLISSFSLNAMAIQTAQMAHCEIRGSRMLAVMPVFHGFGLCVCVHAVLMHGGCSVLLPRFSAEKCGKIVKKYRPTFLAGVPTMFEAITRCKCLRGADLSSIHGVFCGGDTLSEKLREKFDGYLKEHGSDAKIREGYGLTECVTASCLTPYNIQRKESIGIPFPDMYYKICDFESTQEVPYGTVGEICITGPALMLGYLNDEEETNRVLKLHGDGHRWLHTGDAGVMDADGFVYFKQRIKRIIVTSGYNVYPSQIEELLCAHPAVESCCVLGVQDSYKMQRVKAFVVPKQGVTDEKLTTVLLQYCRDNLARYAVPSELVLVNSLPVTRLGKVDFARLIKASDSIGT